MSSTASVHPALSLLTPHRSVGGLPARRLRILHVATPAAIGGLERVLQLLATGQSALGYDVHVAAYLTEEPPPRALLTALAAGGVQVHPVTVAPRGYRQERRVTAELCRRYRFDVVHTHGYRPDLVDAPAARALGCATVTTVHGFTGGGWKNQLYQRLQRRAFRHFDAVVAVSAPLGVQLAADGVPLERLHRVPNAFHAATPPLSRDRAWRALDLPQDAFVVGWVGRLSREKAPDVLGAAIGHRLPHDTILSFIGDGPERAHMEALAAASPGVIRLHGARADAVSLYPAFDVFALSSRTEGTPIALFEAISAGVPVVVTRVGGVPDVVSDREAILVPADDPEMLADAIAFVRDHPRLARQRADNAARRLAREFAAEPWVSRYDAIYRAITSSRPCARS